MLVTLLILAFRGKLQQDRAETVELVVFLILAAIAPAGAVRPVDRRSRTAGGNLRRLEGGRRADAKSLDDPALCAGAGDTRPSGK